MFSLGDTAVALLKAGAETDRKDVDGYLAIDLAPDKQVSIIAISLPIQYSDLEQVRKFILQSAEREGIEVQQ
jgi:26S proteasome non-ATPase regulatory subunit 10